MATRQGIHEGGIGCAAAAAATAAVEPVGALSDGQPPQNGMPVGEKEELVRRTDLRPQVRPEEG